MSNVAFATDRFRGGNSSGSSRMDNKKQGHFALFRSVLTTDWAKDIAKLALWVRLLGEATYRPRSVEFAGREWFLQPGQLVTTPAIMARKLRDQDNSEKSPQAVTRMLKFFTKEGMISTAGSPFGTVITITNYARYQGILGDEPSDNPSDKPKASNGAGLKVVADNPTDEPSDKQNKKVLNKNIKDKTPHTPQGGDIEGAEKALEYYNQLTNSSCRSAEPYLKLMTATTARKAYTLQDVCLVTRWAITAWTKKDKTLPKPENICRVKRFDGYLSDAEKWQSENVDIDCQAVIDAYNEVTEGRMPPADLYRDREIAIRELVTVLAKKNVDGFRNYFKAFLENARDFYFGGPDGSGWCANFDTLMDQKTLRKVKEGSL